MLATAIYDVVVVRQSVNNSCKVITASQTLWWSRFYLDKRNIHVVHCVAFHSSSGLFV